MKPVRLGDTITARVTVMEVIRERNRIRLLTVCRNQRGEEVLTGEALVMPSNTRVVYPKPREHGNLFSIWTLAPWAWAAQSAALWTMLGFSALSLGSAGPAMNGHPRATYPAS